MSKARQKKTFSRDDMADNEEDFEKELAKAMAASAASEKKQASPRRGDKPVGHRSGRSRSRSRRGMPQRRSPDTARGRQGGGRSRSPRGRDATERRRSRSPAQRGGGRNAKTPQDKHASTGNPKAKDAVLDGRQKAKEAMAKEKEKALLKKQQREKEQQDRLATKEKEKAIRQEEVNNDIGNAGALAVISASPAAVNSNTKVSALAQTDAEQAADAAAATTDAAAATAALAARQAARAPVLAAERPPVSSVPKKLDEGLVRQLFQLLDRSGKDAVSKRDVLVGLKKSAALRFLFGLPVGKEGDDLQARINAIQDAFEASSGLGEVGVAFEELSKSGGGQNFAWDSFLVYCQQETVRSRAADAVNLLPREHTVGASFEATYEWKIVPKEAACIAGLEFKMDMATGRTLGRLPRPSRVVK